LASSQSKTGSLDSYLIELCCRNDIKCWLSSQLSSTPHNDLLATIQKATALDRRDRDGFFRSCFGNAPKWTGSLCDCATRVRGQHQYSLRSPRNTQPQCPAGRGALQDAQMLVPLAVPPQAGEAGQGHRCGNEQVPRREQKRRADRPRRWPKTDFALSEISSLLERGPAAMHQRHRSQGPLGVILPRGVYVSFRSDPAPISSANGRWVPAWNMRQRGTPFSERSLVVRFFAIAGRTSNPSTGHHRWNAVRDDGGQGTGKMSNLRMDAGLASFVFTDDAAGARRSILVFFFRPRSSGRDARIVIAMHGFDRAASFVAE
jgi:hypothetical protein